MESAYLSYSKSGNVASQSSNVQTQELATARRRITHLSQFFLGACICKCSKNRIQCALIAATITYGI